MGKKKLLEDQGEKENDQEPRCKAKLWKWIGSYLIWNGENFFLFECEKWQKWRKLKSHTITFAILVILRNNSVIS